MTYWIAKNNLSPAVIRWIRRLTILWVFAPTSAGWQPSNWIVHSVPCLDYESGSCLAISVRTEGKIQHFGALLHKWKPKNRYYVYRHTRLLNMKENLVMFAQSVDVKSCDELLKNFCQSIDSYNYYSRNKYKILFCINTLNNESYHNDTFLKVILPKWAQFSHQLVTSNTQTAAILEST